MGEFSRQLLEVNGPSGHAYSIRRNSESFGKEDLSDIRFYAIWRGHVAMGGSIELHSKADVGLIKVKPEFSPDEIHEIEEAGFAVGTDPIHEHEL